MLLPEKMPKKVKPLFYMTVCAMHGFLYGVLYAPAQALLFHLDFSQMIAWIGAGLPYDALHCVGNAVAGLLILPLSKVLLKLRDRTAFR